MLLIACVVLTCAAAAEADTTVPITDTGDGSTPGTLSVTRTNNVSPGWDEIDLHFASWTVAQSGNPTFIEIVYGTWTGVGGNLGVSSLGGSDWVPRTTDYNSSTPLESFVNLESTATPIPNQPDFARGAGSAGSYASFTGSWFTQGLPGGTQQDWQGRCLGPYDMSPPGLPYDDQFDETLLAKIYVTSGGEVTFDGSFGAAYNDEPPPALAYVPVRFSTAVPEPSVLDLLATGLIAAAICVWRKRG
jgi:hypothetical protein